jgi:hypothetical protein
MNRWRVGEDMGSKETDGCPLTMPMSNCLWGGFNDMAMMNRGDNDTTMKNSREPT